MTPFPRNAYRPLEPYAPDRRPVALDLSDNTNRWGTHPAALALIRDCDPEELLRYPPVYADRLKAAIARRFQVPEEAISTGCGSDDLLDSAFRAACEPGQGVRYLPPTFSMIEIFARMNGLETLPLYPEEEPGDPGSWSLPDPEQVLAGNPGLIYLCRPNNPTGQVQEARWVEALIKSVGDEGPVLLLDEAYADFMGIPESVDDSSPSSHATPATTQAGLLHRAVDTGRVVVLRTLSKAYGLAGLRVGFAVGAPQVIREIEKSRGPYKVNRLAEAAAVAALEDREGWVVGITEEVRRERNRLDAELRTRGLSPLPSGGNFLCVPLDPSRWRGTDPGLESGAGTVTDALRERGIAVRPFPALPGLGDAIRVTIGPRREMDAFLLAVDEMIR